MNRLLLLCFILALLTGCGPRSLQDFADEGENVTLQLIQELEPLQSREELLTAAPRIKQLFEQLVTLIISAKEFREKHPKAESIALSERNHELSEQLRFELNRIYKIDEGREIIEKCQNEALNRLDAFTKKKLLEKK